MFHNTDHRPHILVVGSLNMDLIAETDRFPVPGQTLMGRSFSMAPGGKGANQAVQTARLGCDVTMLGKLGCDNNGQALLQTCKDTNLNTDSMLFDQDSATGCAMIVIEKEENGSSQNRILVIPGANMTITPEEVAFLEEEISHYDMVILQNEIPMAINTIVARYAHAKGVPVMLNPAPAAELPAELLGYITYLSPNETEAEALTGVHIDRHEDTADLIAAQQAAEILHRQGAANVLITLGQAGAALFTWKNSICFCSHAPCFKVHAVDPTAAGDSFIGAFCTAVCHGEDALSALTFANRTASLTVTRMGAIPSLPTLDEVLDAMK